MSHLQEAAEELANMFEEDRPLLQEAVHASADPEAKESEPVFDRAATAVEDRWLTFRGKYKQGATTILRATLLAAIDGAAHASDELSALVWYAGSSSSERYESHNLSSLHRSIIRNAGTRTQEVAHEIWSLRQGETEIDTISNAEDITTSTPKRPSDKWVGKQIASAAGVQKYDGEAVSGKNQYAPNQGRNWSDEFADQMESFLVNYGNKIQKLNGKALEELAGEVESAMGSLIYDVRSAVRNALKEVIEAQTHLDRRSRLLWWSRALHSVSLDVSYRNVPSPLVPFAAALDAQQLTGPFAPLSVESLLREVVATVETKNTSVPALAENLNDHSDTVADLAAPFATDLGTRVPIVRHLSARATGASLPAWTEASGTEPQIEAGALAIRIFRSAQAHALAYDV